MAWAARTAAGIMAVVSPALAVAATLIFAGLPAEWRPEVTATPQTAAGLTFPAVGAFLIVHRPRLKLAWLMCVGGLGGAASDFFQATMLSAAAEGDLATAGYLRLAAQVGWAVCGLGLAMLLPLYSPDGRLPSPRWRLAVLLGALSIGTEAARQFVRPDPSPVHYPYPSVIPNPLQIPALTPYNSAILTAAWTGIFVTLALAALSLLVRMRRADPIGRRQIGWPLLAFTGYIVFLLGGMLVPELNWVAIAWAALVPVTVAISAMRYRLYGIDTVVSRTFVAAGLLAVVSAVYFGAGALSSLLVSGYDQVAGLVSALLAGAFFQPLRRALQRAVDRLLYGRVGDPRMLADRLVQAVRRGDPAEALAAVVGVLREGLAVEGVAVEVADGEPAYVDSGHVGASPREVPLVWHGERVGRLLVGPPSPRRFPAAHNERVLATLIPYAADVAHAVRMAADLQRSRERILAAREEERRRLRRDLHDGLGQSLSAMAMTLNMARLNLKDSPEAADELLRDLHAGMDSVAGDIRQLVYGLRPPALDDLGLAGAVRALAERAGGPAAEVTVEGDLDDLPAAVEVAVYRIAQEALTNVRRHARASRAEVVLRREPAALRLLVADDGAGLPPDRRAGVGLSSMRERTAELGGICLITGEPGAGTTVEVMLPVPASAATSPPRHYQTAPTGTQAGP
ncbi:signal transduction histidine kinase [Thermocatellispora tengchongensis]|uniref:Oxygen sensor histidine kinase NreB n=1 Tax=Thermocatellispora tengchongensis TaxID=1073253 RepID=A0A840NWY9_9ACTN|nr:sensor histidine kinase [Thermocatellispora tengchongensis]MBB5133354.1 signal transduction histidine kinase [Thermocatellispora tengchongensis]